MLPKTHIILGLIFSAIIWGLFPEIGFLGFMIIFLSSVLIDFEHYVYYSIKSGSLSLRKHYWKAIERTKKWHKLKYEEKLQYQIQPMPMHGIEFVIILVVLSFIHRVFFYVLVGIAFHMILDIISLIYYKNPLFKLSQIYNYITNKKKKRFD